jgi:tRNA A-37 threonylcarbamoyl transferase component Bud32/predicted Zn-dependent protease
MNAPDTILCPECGKPVPAASQHQVCPACLLRQALASRTIAEGNDSATTAPPTPPEEIADQFPQFEITECLGRGGMGVVYKARQKSLNRWVAIKILPPERVGEEKFAERFAREAQTLARLNHPNIVTVFDYGETDGLFYIVMEFVDGVNLRDLLRDGKLEPQQALAIVPPICEALQYAHDKGIVHRDIKPENLLLDRDGRIKIADFGIAALVGAEGESSGTPPYMAPEQRGASREVDHRADIYALGVVLYEMLTGERPAKDVVAPSQKVHTDVRLDEMVMRAMEKEPDLRYQTAGEFGTVAQTVAAPFLTKQKPVRHVAWAAVATFLAIPAVLAAIWFGQHESNHPPDATPAVAQSTQPQPAADLTVTPVVHETPAAGEMQTPQPLQPTGDIGRVTDAQGVVSVRARGGDRWSLATPGGALLPGDWLRTDMRGANALRVRLSGGGEVTLGPGTLVEVMDGGVVDLVSGELEASARPGKDHALTVRAGATNLPELRDGARQVVRRSEGNEPEVLQNDPNWLLGFKGAVTTESMGSLLAKVDGRDTPLTIGYHKVTVDIRDQVARTVVEESFVNHTKGTLEGVFYFPLPQDASISGFGMWINNELVEADVVEKERAREIYETILRERRDPGLLEWAGGNLFKARVFPIFGHAEKRIKITYTQVLPLRHGVFRYHYALQSEMLRQHPLRELSINVRAHSALPIAAAACATHDARISHTAHAAQAEFTAQEYTPQRDFEFDVKVDAAAAPVVLIPHRRGEDGYFLALVTPPGGDGDWSRETVADGPPLHLVILADTSGSMDETARANQDALVAALLSSLGEKDTFELATCDNETRWAPAGQAERAAQLAVARDFLAARTSLGWTDLDQAFAAVCDHVKGKPGTQVIYIGDGVPTTGDADPVAFAKRLKLLGAGSGATFHAVAPSSRFESGVLKTIASLGGGSVRRVGGSDTPSAVAQRLLVEMARPGLRGLKVSFEGLRTARVYPTDLPNLPDGEQQIVLGRYLPDGAAQAGKIVVTGTRDGKPVTFSAPVALADAELGNSFIPRLWARLHLDSLLEQGGTPAVKDEIIALSQDFQIMTPYTSFLVLESDADRERFLVKRTFAMRDGERFFAQGRDAAQTELLEKQMRLAGTWRVNLRRGVLQDLKRLGREYDPRFLPQQPGWGGGSASGWGGGSGMGRLGGLSIVGGSEFKAGFASDDLFSYRLSGSNTYTGGTVVTNGTLLDNLSDQGALDGRLGVSIDHEWAVHDEGLKSLAFKEIFDGDESFAQFEDFKDKSRLDFGESNRSYLRPVGQASAGGRAFQPRPRVVPGKPGYDFDSSLPDHYTKFISGNHWRNQIQGLPSLFPPDLGKPATITPDRTAATEPHPWPAEAIALADRLLRREKLTAMAAGGLNLTRNTTSHDPRRGVETSVTNSEAWISAKAWAVRTSGDRQDTLIEWWAEDGDRGRMALALGLGRTRPGSAKEDRNAWPSVLTDYSESSLADALRTMTATVKDAGEGRKLLELADPNDGPGQISYLIDTTRNVVLEVTHRNAGKVVATESFSDFVEVAGGWWARRVESKDAAGKLTSLIELTVTTQSDADFRTGFEAMVKPREKVLFINGDLPAVPAAKFAATAGKESFESVFALCNHFADSQQWERVEQAFAAMRKLAGAKPGIDVLETRLLAMKRRNEEARMRILAGAKALSATPDAHELFLADRLRGEANPVTSPAEQRELLEILKPVYQRAPERLSAMTGWHRAWIANCQALSLTPEALALAGKLARELSWDIAAQTEYANLLSTAGDNAAGLAWLMERIQHPDPQWNAEEVSSLRMSYVNLAEAALNLEEIRRFTAEWMAAAPDDPNGTWPYSHWLSAMIRLGKTNDAYAQIDTWLSAATSRPDGTLDARTRNQLGTALEILTGRVQGVQMNDIPARFHPGLAKVVETFALSPKDASFAEWVMGDYRFTRTEMMRTLRKRFTEVLRTSAAELEVATLNRLLGWSLTSDPAAIKNVWEPVTRELMTRWEREPEQPKREALAAPIERLLAVLGAERHLAFLRRQRDEAPAARRAAFATRVFDTLLARDWTPEKDAEAFGLLYEIDFAPADKDRLQLARRVGALMKLDDWVLAGRFKAAWENIENKEDLSRTEYAAKQKEVEKTIRLALLARLTNESTARKGDVAKAMADWVACERLYLLAVLKQETRQTAAGCWALLNRQDLTDITAMPGNEWLDDVLIDRHLAIVEFLAAQPKADPAAVTQLLDWLNQRIAAHPEEDVWKQHLNRMLLALDRTNELMAKLIEWTQRDSETRNTWRIALGYLQAESGAIEPAVREFEAVEKDDELGPTEYRSLADWYLLLKRKTDRDRALVSQYAVVGEWALANRIQQDSYRMQRGYDSGTPEEFDPAVVDMFRAVFHKSQDSRQHLFHLGLLYRYTKDFRLLECLPEGVVGNSAGQIYAFLGSLDQVLQYVNDEAVCDQVLDSLAKVRSNAKTRVDARGLDLLDLLVRRRAATVRNQPGQQLPMALAAMQRAFADGHWGTGERRLMAQFLAGLGVIPLEPLAAEQRRELQVLYQDSPAQSADHLHIGAAWAGVLRGYGKTQEAVDLLASALQAYRATQGGLLTPEAQAPFDQWIGYHEADRHFDLGEKAILSALDMKVLESVRQWLVERKSRVYVNALKAGGSVSLGQSRDLFDRARQQLIDGLSTPYHGHRSRLCGMLIEIHAVAHNDAKLTDVSKALVEFASGPFDQHVPFQTESYLNLTRQLGDALQTIAGAREALAFYITRLEKEPEMFRATYQSGWNTYGHQVAHCRTLVKDLGDLEPRLLDIALAELRRDLESGQRYNRYLYHNDTSYFWSEKRADFLALALKILQEQRTSLVVVKRAAEYLFNGLDAHDEAVAALTEAHERKLLDEEGISQLAGYLETLKKDAEAVPYLVEVVAMNPGNPDYRRRLIGALGRSGQADQALAAVAGAVAYFKEKHAWNEAALSALSFGCHQGRLWQRGVEWFDELIALHQRTQPARGIGNGTLSGYYAALAGCHSGLDDTAKAVDAAAGAIVSWGKDSNNRANALNALRGILTQSKNLDGYVETLDKQVAESGLENPVVRKALGGVYAERKEFAKAIHNLRLAVAAQPDDVETHKLLFAAYDANQDAEGALRQLLAAVSLSPRNPDLFKDLGARFERLQHPDDAERARTGMVEALPNESEGHAMLAEIRQTQNRWPEAIGHWQRVAAIRSLEPTGLLNLAKAQVHEKQWADARESAKKLLAREWPPRFGDMHNQAAAILKSAESPDADKP